LLLFGRPITDRYLIGRTLIIGRTASRVLLNSAFIAQWMLDRICDRGGGGYFSFSLEMGKNYNMKESISVN